MDPVSGTLGQPTLRMPWNAPVAGRPSVRLSVEEKEVCFHNGRDTSGFGDDNSIYEDSIETFEVSF